jgi:3-hydroxyisobutyrate dehydrogenase
MNIGFIGLGNMGLPIAANLLKSGHTVTGYDLLPEARAAHAANGGIAAASLAEAVAAAETVITMLPAGRHVAAAYAEIIQAAPKATLFIDSSTIDVATARSVAATSPVPFLDAPVSGGTRGAAAGTLTFMVGGPESGFAAALPILQAMGKNIVHAGSAGAGQAAKICNNMILGISMLGVSEAFVLADRLGLDRQKLFDIASTSSGACWALTVNCPAPGPVPAAASNRDYAGGFAAALMLKDLLLSQQAAEAAGAPTPMGAKAAAQYQSLVDAGEGGFDFSVAFRWLAQQSRTGG